MEELLKEKRGFVISIGQLFSAGIVVVGVVLSFWISTSTRLTALELRMNGSDKTTEQFIKTLDKINDGVVDIKVTIQNKQDKK